MGTLIGLLGLSRNALAADQEAINVSANNVANQNTAGYTRQVVSFSATDSVNINGQNVSGSWVQASVTSQRSRVLEQNLQQATSAENAASARLTALQSVESMFGLSSTDENASSTQLGSAMDSFFSSLSSLTANPSDATTRQAVLSAASSLADSFNTAAQGLQSEVSGLNADVQTAASQIDSLTTTIAGLNKQIEALDPNQDAGTLEDQRQQAIKQLSGLLGVNTISTERNGITLTTSSGAVLVDGSNSYSVSTTTVDGKTQIVAGDPPTVQSGITGGTIGGLLQARDSDIPALQSQLDQLAYGIGTAVNTQNEAGISASGDAGSAIFSVPTSAEGAAASISVSLTSTDGIATAGSGEGVQGTTNALALAKLGTADLINGDTASDFFSNFIGSLGTTVSSATTTESATSAALTQSQSMRDSYSAVSLDEEASALSQYQRSYQAAAKVFSIVDELMASAINLGVQTSVS